METILIGQAVPNSDGCNPKRVKYCFRQLNYVLKQSRILQILQA